MDNPNIEVLIIDVLRKCKEITQFFLNKKVREKCNYTEKVIDSIIDKMIKDTIIIRSDDTFYYLKKYGKSTVTSNAEVKLFLNPELKFDDL